MRSDFTHKEGFTLVETMVGLAIFLIAGLSTMEVFGLMNQNATVNRALTAGRLLVSAKIAKAQMDVYTPSNGTIPVGCAQPTSQTYANQDPNDPFDFPSSNLTVVGGSDTGPLITGTMNQSVATYEAKSGTLLVTFWLNFTFRGKTYTVTQSTLRAPDQL